MLLFNSKDQLKQNHDFIYNSNGVSLRKKSVFNIDLNDLRYNFACETFQFLHFPKNLKLTLFSNKFYTSFKLAFGANLQKSVSRKFPI